MPSRSSLTGDDETPKRTDRRARSRRASQSSGRHRDRVGAASDGPHRLRRGQRALRGVGWRWSPPAWTTALPARPLSPARSRGSCARTAAASSTLTTSRLRPAGAGQPHAQCGPQPDRRHAISTTESGVLYGFEPDDGRRRHSHRCPVPLLGQQRGAAGGALRGRQRRHARRAGHHLQATTPTVTLPDAADRPRAASSFMKNFVRGTRRASGSRPSPTVRPRRVRCDARLGINAYFGKCDLPSEALREYRQDQAGRRQPRRTARRHRHVAHGDGPDEGVLRLHTSHDGRTTASLLGRPGLPLLRRGVPRATGIARAPSRPWNSGGRAERGARSRTRDLPRRRGTR